MKGRERLCAIRSKQRSSRNVLQRSVEPAAMSGRSITLIMRSAALRQKPSVAKPSDKTSDLIRKVKPFLPASEARRANAIEVLGYSNVGHLGSRHTSTQ
jgi:hypothetical protein